MHKALWAVLLLAAFALTSTGSTPPSLTTPQIVASGRLVNQTAPFSKTLYTPGVSGVYRLSAYATLTTAISGSFSSWLYGLKWTDVTGQQQFAPLLGSTDFALGQFSNAASGINVGGSSTTFQVNAGTPITHSTVFGASTPDGSAYAVYYVLERIE